MKNGLLISYTDHYEFSINGSIVTSTKNNRRKRKLSKENCDELFCERKDDFVHYMPVYIVSEVDNLIILKNIHDYFFRDYISLRCNHQEFKILREYLHKAGWGWFDGHGKKNKSLFDYNPKDLALIYAKIECDKTIIPYFLDEIEYIDYDKDVTEIIRDIKLNELGI